MTLSSRRLRQLLSPVESSDMAKSPKEGRGGGVTPPPPTDTGLQPNAYPGAPVVETEHLTNPTPEADLRPVKHDRLWLGVVIGLFALAGCLMLVLALSLGS